MKRGMKSIRNTMRVKQMLQYINEHYWEDFTVKDIAEYAGVSESECLRCFRNCGFSDSSYFTKSFREWRGIAPGEYRKVSV